MPLLRPDEYRHANDNYPIVDSRNAKGALFHVDDIGGRDAIPFNKRSMNQYVNVGGDLYHYIGANLLDATWEDTASWVESNEKLKRIVFIESNADFLTALGTPGEVLGIITVNDGLQLAGVYPISASRITIVGNTPIRISTDGVVFTNVESGTFCIMNINVPVLADIPLDAAPDPTITYTSSNSKTLILGLNYLGVYPAGSFTAVDLALIRTNQGTMSFNWTNISPDMTITPGAGTYQTNKNLGEGYFMQEIVSDSLVLDKRTGTETGRWDINLPANPYKVEWIAPTAFSAVETWDPAAEVSASLDYAIMPKITQDPTTGSMYMSIAVCSGHNTFTDRIAVFRKSVDGGVTWTNLAGVAGHSVVDFFGDGSTVDLAASAFTNTGRWVIFIRRFVSGSYENSYVAWSDDEGITWSDPVLRGYFLSYAFDNKFCYGEKGELLISQGIGSSTVSRQIQVYHSFDNGETWELRSTVYNASGNGLGETMMRDYGNGLMVMVMRSAGQFVPGGTFAGLNLPAMFISKDYGMTWAGGTETITESNLNDGDYHSGYLPLEGATVSLGDNSYGNCLPHFERVDYNGHKYVLIVYYLRTTISTETRDELLKMTAFKIDEWLTKGYKAIKSGVAQLVYEADNTLSSGQYDGNGMILAAGNRPEVLWTICDNLTSSQHGNEVIRSGRIDRADIVSLLDSLETASDV